MSELSVRLPRTAGRDGIGRLTEALWARVGALVCVLLGALMLMWTAVANGRPPVFTDTALYYTHAEYLFEAIGWVDPAHAVEPRDDPTALPATPGAPSISASIDRARSPVYGAALYALQRICGLWLAAFGQCLLVATAIYLLFRAAQPQRSRAAYVALMAGLSLLTPLPFFASFMMPDVLAGVAGCALLLLLVYPDRLKPGAKAGAFALAAFALAVHRSNLADALAVTLVAAPLMRWSGVAWPRVGLRAATVLAAAMLATGLNSALEQPIQARAGEPIGSPPFLSARLLADGPGVIYLRTVCTATQAPFELCRFRNRAMKTSDQVLWSIRRRTAVFLAAGASSRLRMEREDTGFALHAALAEPFGAASAGLWNAARQFVEIGVEDPLTDQSFYITDGYWRHTALPRLLPDAGACRRTCPAVVDGGWALAMEAAGLAVAAALIALRFCRPRALRELVRGRCDPELGRTVVALAIVLALLVVNALVCGALSGPFARYQARLVWLVPLVAGLGSMDLPGRVLAALRTRLAGRGRAGSRLDAITTPR